MYVGPVCLAGFSPRAHPTQALSAANELRDHVTEVGFSHRLVIAGKVRPSERGILIVQIKHAVAAELQLFVQNIVGTVSKVVRSTEGSLLESCRLIGMLPVTRGGSAFASG